MPTTPLGYRANGFSKIRTANSTDASFPSRVPTTTEPTGTGIQAWSDFGLDGVLAPTKAIIIPYGVGADNTTFKLRIIGWRLIGTLWVPSVMAEYTCTNCTAVGVASAAVVDTERFCDILTATTGTPSGSTEIVQFGTGTELISHIQIDLKGFQKIEITFNMNSSATSANALVAWV